MSRRTIYTGPNVFQVVGVDKEKTAFGINKKGDKYLKLCIKVSSKHVDSDIVFFLTDRVQQTKDGKKRYVNQWGRISKYVSEIGTLSQDEHFKDFSGILPLLEGEENYLRFIKQLKDYTTKDEKFSKFLLALEKHGLLARQVYEKGFEALDDAIRTAKKDMVLLCSASKTERGGYFQNVENWFYGYTYEGQVSFKSMDYIDKVIKDIAKGGFSPTKNVITPVFSEFNGNSFRVEEPQKIDFVQQAAAVINEMEDDDLPF